MCSIKSEESAFNKDSNMSNSKIYILDHKLLGELNNALEYAADSVLKVQRAVISYLSGVIEVMEHELEVVAHKYEEAKERLEAAQRRLANVQAALESARLNASGCMDGADGFVSTAACAAYGAVNATAAGAAGTLVAAATADCERVQRNCDKWRERHEKAKDIASQCKTYKSDWEYRDAFSFGGDYHLEILGKEHTDEATKKLRKILGVVEKYLDFPISLHTSKIKTDGNVLDKDDKRTIIRNSENRVINEQIKEMNRHNSVGANRVAKCGQCGRPLSICICRNIRNKIELL